MKIGRFAPLVLLAALLVPDPAPAQAPAPPNILLVLTDDQRFDTLFAMPTVQAELAAKGMQLTNAFVSNSVCCPSRSTILTGDYSHTTGVWSNSGTHGGFSVFDDSSTIATWLDDAGYQTGFFGKYLNGYGSDPANTSYIPPGWDRWFAFAGGESDAYGYCASDQGTQACYGQDPADYATTVLEGQAESFIRVADPDAPIFAEVATKAPHLPATPAPGDEHLYDSIAPWRSPAYNEADVSDKPAYIQTIRRFRPAKQAEIDGEHEHQLESLAGVDRAVGDLLDVLSDTGRLSNTLVVFMSDNGFLWGEHRWRVKLVPYEEAIRVPMVVRWDGHIAAGSTSDRLIVNTDVAPTFADAAGVSAPATDGRSLLDILQGTPTKWRSRFEIEHWIFDTRVPSYCGVRTRRYAYVHYSGGFEELYDLHRDPAELRNHAPANPPVLATLRAASCQSPPPDWTP